MTSAFMKYISRLSFAWLMGKVSSGCPLQSNSASTTVLQLVTKGHEVQPSYCEQQAYGLCICTTFKIQRDESPLRFMGHLLSYLASHFSVLCLWFCSGQQSVQLRTKKEMASFYTINVDVLSFITKCDVVVSVACASWFGGGVTWHNCNLSLIIPQALEPGETHEGFQLNRQVYGFIH